MFKLVKNENKGNNTSGITNIKVYEDDNYRIVIFIYHKGEYSTVSCDNISLENYMPNIHLNSNLDTGLIEDITIQTTSYGEKSISDIEKIIEGYKRAIGTIDYIEEVLSKNELLSDNYER